MTAWGQLVIGSPGAGKSTYCAALATYFKATKRECAIINLDPGNDTLPYTAAVNVTDLIKVEDAMDEFKLGPNGGLVYCMEYLEKNAEWLAERLAALGDKYLIFDFPGQVELFTHHRSCRNLAHYLTGKLDYRLAVVHLVDSHHCTDASKYISLVLMSLSTMVHLELPHVNVLSKFDLMGKYGDLPLGSEFYTEVQSLEYLLPSLRQDSFLAKHRKLTEKVCEVIESFNLVAFRELSVLDMTTVAKLVREMDKAAGYVMDNKEQRATQRAKRSLEQAAAELATGTSETLVPEAQKQRSKGGAEQ